MSIVYTALDEFESSNLTLAIQFYNTNIKDVASPDLVFPKTAKEAKKLLFFFHADKLLLLPLPQKIDVQYLFIFEEATKTLTKLKDCLKKPEDKKCLTGKDLYISIWDKYQSNEIDKFKIIMLISEIEMFDRIPEEVKNGKLKDLFYQFYVDKDKPGEWEKFLGFIKCWERGYF